MEKVKKKVNVKREENRFFFRNMKKVDELKEPKAGSSTIDN